MSPIAVRYCKRHPREVTGTYYGGSWACPQCEAEFEESLRSFWTTITKAVARLFRRPARPEEEPSE